MPAPSFTRGEEDCRTAIIQRLQALLPLKDMQTLRSVEGLLRPGTCGTAPRAVPNCFTFTMQELRLVQAFRSLPADERRDSVLEAVELFASTYA